MTQKKYHKKKVPTKYQKKPYESSRYFIYGVHSVLSALDNPKRIIKNLLILQNTLDKNKEAIEHYSKSNKICPTVVDNHHIRHLIDPQANHQGILLETIPLIQPSIHDLHHHLNTDSKSNIIIVLDQITDPHNLGSIMRSAAAFNVKAVITPKDNSVCESPASVKSSCGAFETTPLISVTNLSKTLEELKELGFWCIGLDGHTDNHLHSKDLTGNVAIVMGAEGKGLRRLTQKNCDLIAKLPISPQMESLNVANATSITLYEIHRQNDFNSLGNT